MSALDPTVSNRGREKEYFHNHDLHEDISNTSNNVVDCNAKMQ